MKKKAGIVIYGDYLPLRSVHEIIHDVDQRSDISTNKGSHFLGLAYDLRKAYEGFREFSDPIQGYPEINKRYGFKTIWPVILAQTAFLRAALSYMPTTSQHLAVTYMLEHVIETCIAAEFKRTAPAIIRSWKSLRVGDEDNFERLGALGYMWCTWAPVQRENALSDLLDALPASHDLLYEVDTRKRLRDPNLTPEKIAAAANLEWPDITSL